MNTLLLLLALAIPGPDPVEGGGRYCSAGAGCKGDLWLKDNYDLILGADKDYWTTYNSATTSWEFWTSNSNGAGLDAKIAHVVDGTTTLVFDGAANMGGYRLYDSTDELNLGTSYEAVSATGTGNVAVGGAFEVALGTYFKGAVDFGNQASSNIKTQEFDIPATNTVALNAATVNLNNGDFQVVDLQGATGTVTVTVSNPHAGAWVLKIIQGTQLGTITFDPLLYWSAGVVPVITATDDAIDLVSCVYDGARHLCSITQDLKTAP